MSKQGQAFCFTLNNYTDDELSSLCPPPENVSYLIFGKEMSESGTPHLQGYFETSRRYTVGGLTKLFSSKRFHFEIRMGTQDQAIEYCRKEDSDPYEFGEKRQCRVRGCSTASKNKLIPLIPELKQGLSHFAFHPDVSFHLLKHAEKFKDLTDSPRKRVTPLTVKWYWGPTGSGKTRRAYDEAAALRLEPFVKSAGGKWFDGYDCHRYVILDDFRDSHFEFSFLLRLLDIYPFRVEVKGGSRQWKPEIIVITSPMPPSECYANMQATDKYDKINQLIRRISVVEHVESYDPPSPDVILHHLKTDSPKSLPRTPVLRRRPINLDDSGLRPIKRSRAQLLASPPYARELLLEDVVSPTQVWFYPSKTD